MVRESHKRFMGKYPYFLDKNVGSNFFRTSNVDNRSIQRLYNELFKLYESFHISKRLLIWREQSKDYDYEINFEVNYPNIKEVSIYKDDALIYFEEFPIKIKNDDTVDDSTDHFHYTYTCNHKKEYIQKVTPYQCTECGTIYYTTRDNAPNVCEECNNTTYTKLDTYQCTECGEIYYTTENNPITDCTENNHTNTLQKKDTYQCLSCGTIYYTNTQLEECSKCYIEDYTNKKNYNIQATNTELILENIIINVEITNRTHTKTIQLNYENNWNNTTGLIPYNNKEYYIQNITIENNYELPPNTEITITEIEKIPTSNNLGLIPPEYYDDQTIIIEDNSITTNNDKVIESIQHKYHIKANQVYINGIEIEIYNQYKKLVDTVELNIYNNFEADSKTLDTLHNSTGTEYEYSFKYDRAYDLTITPVPVYNADEDDELDDDYQPVEIPIIPINQFRMEVLTYDEYYLVKGYPERDEPLKDNKNRVTFDVYDHDISLDEIGALNNIPRKKYNIVEDYLLYPLTEPPYNNNGSEDDYHYMKRMLKYNVLLWASMNSDMIYSIDKDYLTNIGVTEDEFNLYKGNARLFVQRFNPVSLELWKIYGLESRLVNREKYLLKVFDEQKHPFDEDTGLVKCWSPLLWEHKDRFCNIVEEDYYFFVNSSTVRPLLYEPVDFEFTLLNNIGEKVEGYDFYVDIYKIHENTMWITDDYKSFREEHSKEIIGSSTNQPNDYYELINKVHNTAREQEFDGDYYLLNHITENKVRVPSFVFENTSTDKDGITILVFVAYNSTTGEEIGRCDVSIKVRDSNNADWYVDQDFLEKNQDIPPEDYVPLGTRKAPFLDLQSAMDKVNVNNDLICVSSKYVDIPSTISVSESANIIGETLNINGTEWIPRLRSSYYDTYVDKDTGESVSTGRLSRRFFNIIGGKGTQLTLCNLRLKSGAINNYVGIQSWINNSPNLNKLETVIIHGGAVKLTLDILHEYTDYYPYDFIPFRLTVTQKGKNNKGMSGMTVGLYYHDNLIKTYVTDNNGVVEDVFNLNETYVGDYSFSVGNMSNLFFESLYTHNIDANQEPSYEYRVDNGSLTWRLTDYPVDSDVSFFIDGELVSVKNTNNEGEVSYLYQNIDWGKHILYTTVDNESDGKVLDECIIESKVSMSRLDGETLVKDLVIDESNYTIQYDTVTVDANSTLSDLDGVVTDIVLDDDGHVLSVESFDCNPLFAENDFITFTDYNMLKNSLTDIQWVDGFLVFNRIGEFK